MDVVNAQQVCAPQTTHSSSSRDVDRLVSRKKQVPVPSWHWNVFPQTSEQKGASPEW